MSHDFDYCSTANRPILCDVFQEFFTHWQHFLKKYVQVTCFNSNGVKYFRLDLYIVLLLKGWNLCQFGTGSLLEFWLEVVLNWLLRNRSITLGWVGQSLTSSNSNGETVTYDFVILRSLEASDKEKSKLLFYGNFQPIFVPKCTKFSLITFPIAI